jgi:hypothetical protein
MEKKKSYLKLTKRHLNLNIQQLHSRCSALVTSGKKMKKKPVAHSLITHKNG